LAVESPGSQGASDLGRSVSEGNVARRDESACLCVLSHARRQAEEW